jgi:hypothetical protein
MGGHGAPPPVEANCQAVLNVNGKEVVVVVPEIEDTLEWVLESPPPLHAFLEPPIFVETDACDSSDKVTFVRENIIGDGVTPVYHKMH